GAGVVFFQAEDGIRDFHVTGVQTCALPISADSPGERGRVTEAFSSGLETSQLAGAVAVLAGGLLAAALLRRAERAEQAERVERAERAEQAERVEPAQQAEPSESAEPPGTAA